MQMVRSRNGLNSLVVIAVILAGIVSSYFIVHDQFLLVFGLFMGILAAVIFLRWPPLGIASLIVASFLVPYGLRTGSQSDINITLVLILLLSGLWVVDRFTSKTFPHVRSSSTYLPLILLGLASILAFLGGQLHILSIRRTAPITSQIGGLAVVILSIFLFFLTSDQIRRLRWLERLTWLFLGLGMVFLVGRALPSLGRYFLPYFQEGATGSLFWVWMVALSFGVVMGHKRLKTSVRFAALLIMLLTLFVALYTARVWASGWLPPIVAILAILWLGDPKLAMFGTLIGAVIVLLNHQQAIDLVMVNEQYSYITRVEAWRNVVRLVSTNPILGLGPANYYWNTEFTPIMGWFVRFSSHNQYIDLFAQTGIVGLACFIWFSWESTKLCLRLRTKVSDGFDRAYVYAVFGGLIGTLAAGMLADWILPFVYNITLEGMRSSVIAWLFLGGLVSLEHIHTQGELVQVEEPVG
jgi:O-antigen ligase